MVPFPAISGHATPAICMASTSGSLAFQVLAININTTVASLMENSQTRIMLATNTKNTGATLTEHNPMRDVRENTTIVEQQEDSYDSEQSRESNVVHLLGEQEANQFRESEFNPKMNDKATRLPTETLLKFLGKCFNQSLTEG